MNSGEGRKWRCRHWVWSAIEFLEQDGLIPELNGSAEEVHRRGLNLVYTNKEVGKVVCFDVQGQSRDIWE
ncbi:hypothetical protein C8Q75DRAFT_744880 [Abortiporus biennis]|nr:hypothetical protein C8Q75DRAFT_744880 [Abortiporus biennis]